MTITLEAYGLIIGIFWGLFGVIGICGYREPRQELAQQRIISKFIIEDKCLNGTLSGFGISFPLVYSTHHPYPSLQASDGYE